MKRLFFLMAAMLLSVGAFAQSENTPIKGDVNGDGVVDVADIASVISIMKNGGGIGGETKYYFSIGTDEVTPSNYTTVNNATTEIPTTIEYTSSQRVRHYVLIPSNKTLSIIDKNVQTSIPMTEDASISIPNHKLYYTNGAIASGATVVITLSDAPTYYYYAGWTLPTADNVDDIINETYPAASGSTVIHTAGKKTTSQSEMDYQTNSLYNANAKATYYVLVPEGQAIYDSLGNNVIASTFTSQGTLSVGNQTHTVYASVGTSRNINAIIIR